MYAECLECGLQFDLLDERESQDFIFGHDCEVM